MANVYYSKQWTDLTDGTVVAVKGGTAVIGTDAFAEYSEAKTAGNVVLCDVFVDHEWADKSSGDMVDVELEGDSYTLNVGEQAFATLEAAAMQVATNQYGGVETYGDNDGITAYGYVSGAWSGLPDYTVVTTGGTVWDEDGATVSGGTAVIGVNAFATYSDANDKLDVYWNESQLNGVSASSDIYLDSSWISASYSEGETVSVTLADGSEVTATLGENAVLLTADTAQAQQEGVTAAANIARAKNSAIYLSGGTFLFSGSSYSGSMFTGGCTAVIGDAYVQRITNGKSSGVPKATPKTYVLAGARVGLLYMGAGTTDTVYAYVGENGYATTISPAYSGSIKTVNVAIDGGTFGSYGGTDAAISEKLNITVKNADQGSIYTGPQTNGTFSELACDVNYTVTDSTLSEISLSGRSITADTEWYKDCNTKIGDFTIDLTGSTVTTIRSGKDLAYWCFEDYNVVLDHATVTTLSPTSGGSGSLAYVGGTATVVGGTFCTPTSSKVTYGEENTESVWSDGDFRYLLLSTSTKTVNGDGSITIVGGIYYNGAAASGSQWIQGGTVTLAGGTQKKFSLSVKGSDTSYVKTLSGFEEITISAGNGASLELGCDMSNFPALTSITIDVDNLQFGASKSVTVLTATGGLSGYTCNVTGTAIDDFDLVVTDTTVALNLNKTVYFSVTWAGLAAGTKVTVAGNTLTIGTNAFASYALAQASGATTIKSVDTYLNSSYNETDPIVLISGYTATFGVDAFADQASAVATAKSMGGALDVTGGSFSGLNVSGIETSIFTDVSTGTTASIRGQNEDIVSAKKNMTLTNVDCNYLEAVSAGTVTGDVNVSATDITTYKSLYLVVAAAKVGGDVTAMISGTSYLTKGLYVVDDGGSIGGNVNITVAGGEIYRRGIQIYGMVDGSSSVTVTGDATISSIMDAFDTVTINEGVTLDYGIGLDGDWENSYLHGFRNLVNNGTLNYNAELGQNAYAMLYEALSGTGTIELGNNVEFVEGGTTYVAEVQKRVLVNGDWSGKEMFDVINVDDGTVIYGVSAFGDKEAAQTSGLTSDVTTFIEYGQVVDDDAYGEDGHLGFAGGTVTGTAFAGEAITEAGGTITQSSELVAQGTTDCAGDYQDLFGSYDIQEYADTTIAADSSLVVGGSGTVTGGMLVGGCRITAAAVDWIGKSTVSVTSGSFSKTLIGGALVDGGDASISGTLMTEVTLSGATVKELCGGCYVQGSEEKGYGSIDVSGTANVTLANCTVVGSVIGGNSANDPQYSTKDNSLWNGNTNITIDTTKGLITIGGDLVAGSLGTGKISGNTSITLSGSGDNLSIGGDITGDSTAGTPYFKLAASTLNLASDNSNGTLRSGDKLSIGRDSIGDSSVGTPTGKCVTGTRSLNFNNFNGTLGSADKKVWCFDAVTLVGSSVTLAGNGDLASVNDWQITDGTFVWTKGENDFTEDQLALTYSGELTDEWTVFQLTDKLATGWNGFETDGSGTSKIILSVNGGGVIAEYDDNAEAYLGTIDGEDYRFYLDYRKYGESSLKVAKTVAQSDRVVAVSGATCSLVDGATYKVAAHDGNGGAVEVQEGGVVTGNNVVFNGNSVTSGYGGAIYNNGTVILSGIFDLTTASDTWVNKGSSGEKCATVNWDLTRGIPDYGSVKHFERYSNLATEVSGVDELLVKQTITVTATQEAGQYVIATGNFNDVTDKDTFIVKTAEDATGATVKIRGAAVGYGDLIYSLTIDDNGTPETLTDDKLILNAEEKGGVLEITKAAGRGPVDDFLVFAKEPCPRGGFDRGSVFTTAFFGGTVSVGGGLLAAPALAL